jgi:hypothetical protein
MAVPCILYVGSLGQRGDTWDSHCNLLSSNYIMCGDSVMAFLFDYIQENLEYEVIVFVL